MALRYGAEVYRNEQEQVAKNASDIKKIFEMLNGLNIQDNVVVVADMSQILRADEIEIVERPIAFIIYNDNVYIKKSESNGSAYFDKIFAITAGNEITFGSEEITVNLNTGSLSLATLNATTYSVATIDALLQSKASLNGANFAGNITAPSIIENMTGYSFNKAENTANRNYNYAYAGAVKNGNKLTLAISVEIEVVSTISAGTYIGLGLFSIPSDIANKLIPYSLGSYSDVIESFLSTLKDTNSLDSVSINCDCNIQKNGRNLTCSLFPKSNLTQGKTYITRLEATFLLSNNLA